ncbi:MAG: bifunctional [glutamate--ammonia ligase]-adenylyl-L-tyrosine phosphorylase/[glutamate--ammonia-ligase] adenylyltransferase, partial [Proteobacteria bacterium]|nr:bifunctional [glutamate--ammonia ligase]-adenylyl-L-tyrosine phosphorylase/[glutamate--ammonia-ligase] adenylyltransferase [Pseudomonadota bacterium]
MNFDSIPSAFRPLAEQRWQDLAQSADGLPDAVRESLPRVFAWSGFVTDTLRAQPELLSGEWANALDAPVSPVDLARGVRDAVAAAADELQLMRVLRLQRHALHARIAWREIAGWASVEESLASITAVADACIDSALHRLHEWHREAHGDARDANGNALRLVVLGMGKLGGRELNFSSDVDLVFAFESAGESDGPRPLANEQYFSRLGQKLIRVLDEVTADGFAYRVDMRLRPFGDGGPLVMTLNGVESYYEQHGREWERYAFVKARPVAGDLLAGESLLKRLQPFIYRRYLDFGVFESLREMKSGINREVQRRELRNHVKLGPGGIREAEFVVQLFQLIRGGREPALRERSFRTALRALARLDCLAAADAAALEQAYDFLRRLENRLQHAFDQQVHAVPDPGHERDRLAFSLGFTDVAAFEQAWAAQRDVVRGLFDDAFLGPESQPDADPLNAAWNDALVAGRLALANAGFADEAAVASELAALHERVERQPPGTQGLRRLNRLMPRLIASAARQANPDIALHRMLKLVEAVLGRTTYLALLLESPRALDQLARFCAASGWIAQLVTRHPLLLDELLDPRLFEDVPTRETLALELDAQLSRYAAQDAAAENASGLVQGKGDDLEALMDALREFQQVSVLRIAAADISGHLPLMKVSDRLTDVAELVIQAVLQSAESHLLRRHGEPCFERDGETRRARFLVVGYGKLGGLELGYGSDLDLVFLHDSTGEQQCSRGERSIDNSVFFLRLTQRLIHLLSTPTAAGVLYEVDTRLRPSGKAGLLVSSMDAFEKYQLEEAWTWEHQALLRSRAVAGDSRMAD